MVLDSPQQLKSLAWDLTENHINMDDNGCIDIPTGVGHAIKINQSALEQYGVDVDIYVNKDKQTVLWTVYHTILALELLAIIIIEGIELLR